MTAIVELEGVTKRFGDHTAVNNLSLAVPEGTIYGLVGPNGSGKTTTLRIILRILYPERGRVTVLGSDHGSTGDERIGYLPQHRGSCFPEKMRVRNLLEHCARLKGFRYCRRDIDEWLERFDLIEWADHRLEALSKGIVQKVLFIGAVMARPKLVILDEPFKGLDPVNVQLLKRAVLRLHQAGATVILSTRDTDAAERICEAVCMIPRGRKAVEGRLESSRPEYSRHTIRLPGCLMPATETARCACRP